MSVRSRGDSGQAFPVYITVMAGLLFLALVYFAVGQAAANRNGGQTAADAAALAAAQDAREQLRQGWLEVILDPDAWDAYVRGDRYDVDQACDEAAAYAAKNGAQLWHRDDGCRPVRTNGAEEFRVRVRTDDSVGRSLVPGTEDKHTVATATAVLKPRCSFDAPEPTPPPTPATPTPSDTATPQPTPTPSPEPEPITGLVCDGIEWTIDPDHPRLPDAADLFTVRLAD
ncbi:pilus assembly protein TadG-related protein [Streptomyces sp. NPDC053493]|uniref:pilus assembly protein TadG-related protein n=1 Tax=Streptomyces sp. NPDC053493 TaxID=3365705 RepID=UPI0037D3EBC5